MGCPHFCIYTGKEKKESAPGFVSKYVNVSLQLSVSAQTVQQKQM